MIPFYTETELLFSCVSKHDFETLADLCDDFGIIDLVEYITKEKLK